MKRPKIISYFFGPGKKSFAQKVEEAMPAIIKVLPEIRALYRGHTDPTVASDGTIIGEMYDFAKTHDNLVMMGNPTWSVDDPGPADQNTDQRKIVKPVEVQKELELQPRKFDLKDLDKTIAVLKDKKLLTNQRFVEAQLAGIIKRLENRKRYEEFRDFFESFPCTTDEKIDELLSKYKLVIQHSELFIPSFPDEAIDVMKKYSEITMKIAGEKPVFYVIAEEKDFEQKRKRLDPILLAQSPFGFYWQILGAWDKEMILLSEL